VPREVRPTEARVREALLSIWGERLEGARVLELFAGSGAVALDALGRGALSATAVENEPRALAVLEGNAAKLGESAALAVVAGALPLELARLARRQPQAFDLVFADPPYAFRGHAVLLAGIEPLLAPGGEAVLENAARDETPIEAGGLVRVDRRRYGETGLSFYRPSAG
jgi:16S rRNA (guanine(966)-N(2))-methyltransferase RsmD